MSKPIKLATCQCGERILYKDSACSPECYLKIKDDRKVEPISRRLATVFVLNNTYGNDLMSTTTNYKKAIQILWKWMTPYQKESAAKEIANETIS